MSLTAKDNGELSRIGGVLLVNFVKISIELSLYGIYLSMFPYSLIILWLVSIYLVYFQSLNVWLLSQKPFKTRATYCLVLLTTTLFVVSTVRFGTGIAVVVMEVKRYLLSPNAPLGPSRRIDVGNGILPGLNVDFVAQSINIIIADGIVIWRAYVLFDHSRILRIIMAAAVVLNTLLQLSYLILGAIDAVQFAAPVLSAEADVALNWSSTFMSFGTNALAAILIAYRAWRHGKQVQFGVKRKRTPAERILLLLAETGTVLAIFQLVNAILTVVDLRPQSPLDFAATAINELTNQFAVIFPTLIIIIVGRKNTSVFDSTFALDTVRGSGTPQIRAPSSTLRFASVHTSVPDTMSSGTAGVRETQSFDRNGGSSENKTDV